MRGERKPYVAPLQLFFLANIVFFVWVGVTHINTFSTPLKFHVQGMFYSGLAHRLVDARVAARHITYDSYAATFDHAATLQAKSLIILMVPMLALVTMLVTLPRRRSATHHFVFALHTMTVTLLFIMAISLVLGLAESAFMHAGVAASSRRSTRREKCRSKATATTTATAF